MVTQQAIQLKPYSRGIYLITNEILKPIGQFPEKSLMNIFIKHTSAGLAINENGDPSVRVDFEKIMNQIIPENQAFYTHTRLGPDDIPSHVKSTMTGHSLPIPITHGKLNWCAGRGFTFASFGISQLKEN